MADLPLQRIEQERLDLTLPLQRIEQERHPNVVTLYASTILDMGRTKEALLVMEYCDKSLVTVLENRGAGYFEEKEVLSIFRDVCNAVFAMHCHSPPIAHRDLKAENLLLGSDGLWKLCDFGSTTNHKRFERPEEMGVEEDNIRKHTTPAYRAPERQGNEGKLGELQQGLFNKNSPNTGTSWQPFTDDTSKKAPVFDSPKSVRTRNGNPGKQDGSTGSINDEWGFGNDSFSAVPSASARISRSSGEGNKSQSQRFGDSNKLTSKTASQPAGWSGF